AVLCQTDEALIERRIDLLLLPWGASPVIKEKLESSRVRHNNELELETVKLIGGVMVKHVLQQLREPLRLPEIAVIEASDIGVLLHRSKIEVHRIGACLAGRRQCRTRCGKRADDISSAREHMILPGMPAQLFVSCGAVPEPLYSLAGLCGLINNDTTSLI